MNKKKVVDLFTAHPHSVNETYFQHLRYASVAGLKLIFAGIACVIHSVFPFLFINTASNIMKKISEEMQNRRENT